MSSSRPCLPVTAAIARSGDPLPDDEQRAALRIASDYLQSIGRQVASGLLGCPPLYDDATILARHSTVLLRSAELCTGLVELAEQEPL